jgi:ribonuclease E
VAQPHAPEPESKEAVTALDAAPAHAETPQPAPPRRRSTVREPAPIGGGAPAAPPASQQEPAPAASELPTETAETEDANKPRRTGWWSRRFAGG